MAKTGPIPPYVPWNDYMAIIYGAKCECHATIGKDAGTKLVPF